MHEGGFFNPDSLAAVNKALDDALSDESAQGLIITGEGKIFSQGLDLEYLSTLDLTQFRDFVEECMAMIGRLLCYPLPLVNVVNGHAFGLGAMIALAGDYKVMRQDRGYICLPEIDLGMIFPPSMNALVCDRLPGTIRRDMMLTGKRVAAEEAVAHQIVDASGELGGLLEQGKQLAVPMMGKPRDIIARIKRGMNLDVVTVIEAGASEPANWNGS